MRVARCMIDGRPGYRAAGVPGAVAFTYTPGDAPGRDAARALASRSGWVLRANREQRRARR